MSFCKSLLVSVIVHLRYSFIP